MDALIHQWVNHPYFFYLTVGLVSLCVGSFLNVVIYRFPKMLFDDWHEQCQTLLADDNPPETSEQPTDKFNLMTPRSHCPNCDIPLRLIDNIPVISFLCLRGKCHRCETPIPYRYPAIELLTMVLSLVVAMQFGPTLLTVSGVFLTWVLIVLSFIDFDHQILPDDITLPVMWLGILLSFFGWYCNLPTAVIGAMAGYLSLWSIFWLFKFLTGKEGMGYGDFKLLALLGAWLGWMHLPVIILLSSVVGAVIGISMVVFRGHDRSVPIPFGPYLAIAGWLSLLFGDKILAWYLSGTTLIS